MYLRLTSLKLRDDDADYAALIIGDTFLGGGFLNSRLATRIRQQDGLSYTVSSQLAADALDAVGSFSIFAICAPQNIATVEKDAQEELARVLTAPFTPGRNRHRKVRNPAIAKGRAGLGWCAGRPAGAASDSSAATSTGTRESRSNWTLSPAGHRKGHFAPTSTRKT